VAQVLEELPKMCEALSSNPSTAKKKKRKKNILPTMNAEKKKKHYLSIGSFKRILIPPNSEKKTLYNFLSPLEN
jgi:cell division protein FtsN